MKGTFIPAASPPLDGCELGLRQLRDDIEPPEHDLAGLPIERYPVAFLDLLSGYFSAISALVDPQIAAADEADLAELACDDRSVSRAPSDGGENAGSRRETGDVIGRGLAPYQNHRLFFGGESLGADTVEGDSPGGDAGGRR